MKDNFKTEEGVFDQTTRMAIYEFMNHGLIANLNYPISTGKEADVYCATTGPKLLAKTGNEFIAVKIFRTETSDFQRMTEYIFADPRFYKVKRSKREIIYAWTKKEFKNLQICKKAKVPCPKPIAFGKNVLIMDFIGEEGIPDSTLKDLGSDKPEKDCDRILGYIKKLYKAGLVHGDLSEFNILMHGYPDIVPYVIDIGQGVVLDHPKSADFLERDIQNVLQYFKKYKVRRDFTTVLNDVLSARKDEEKGKGRNRTE